MAFSRQFERQLDRLFRKRTQWLRSKLGLKRTGKPPIFSRRVVNRGISRLQDLALNAFAWRLAKSTFDEHVSERRNWQVKGRGRDEQIKHFRRWFKPDFGNARGHVYSFWSGQKSLYVGRTGRGGGRPASHFKTFWFSRASRVTIFRVRGRKNLPRVECLAIHHFRPVYNTNTASSKKWTKSCPLCDIHEAIEGELRDIFRLR